MKKILFTAAAFLLMNNLFAQESIADKGSLILGGVVSYTNQKDVPGRSHQLALEASADKLISNHIFIGGTVRYGNVGSHSNYIDSYAVGPDLGYIWDKKANILYPFVSAGYLFNKSDGFDDFSEISAGAGVIVPLKKHIGLSIKWNFVRCKFGNDWRNSTFTTDLSVFTVGINGLFYKSK